MKKKLLLITTVPETIFFALEEQIPFFLNNGFNVFAITSKGTWVTIDDISTKYDIKVFRVNFIRKISLFNDFFCIIKLIFLFKIIKPHILHVSTPKASLLSLIASCFCNISKNFYTIRGLPYEKMSGIRKNIFTNIDRFCCYLSHIIFSVSQSNYSYLIHHKICKKNKLHIIGKGSSRGVNYRKFNPEIIDKKKCRDLRISLNINEADFIFGFVGRMVKDKGIEDLATAWQNLSNILTGAHLVLVGPQIEPRDNLSSSCYNYLNSVSSIHLTNDVKNPFIYYSIFNALVHPSYREGFPNVVLEAGSMRLPVITTNALGCVDSVINNKTGLVYEVGNIDQLISCMHNLFNNRSLCKKLGASAQDYIIKNFDPMLIAKELVTFYKGDMNECSG